MIYKIKKLLVNTLFLNSYDANNQLFTILTGMAENHSIGILNQKTFHFKPKKHLPLNRFGTGTSGK